ncbi:MAG: transcriptional regulator, TetR family [Caulobacteraceae bacterium]|jgi:AcrR family transcriptional regulator|nr:transcriptional regulator, TetR family [Caulobacteraceae bacterium]
MNILSSLRQEAGGPTSLRAQSKLKTRRRVLESARGLFMERGYEAATIRDIASAAGLSTGAVFASFLDKTDLFNAVMAEDFQRQVEGVKQAEQLDAGVDEAVLAIFKVGYSFHFAQLPLLQAAISLSWSAGLGGEFGDRPSYRLALEAVIGVLARAVERGELAARTDLKLTAEILWDTYVANYRRALFDEWTQDQLIARNRLQIALILSGFRA